MICKIYVKIKNVLEKTLYSIYMYFCTLIFYLNMSKKSTTNYSLDTATAVAEKPMTAYYQMNLNLSGLANCYKKIGVSKICVCFESTVLDAASFTSKQIGELICEALYRYCDVHGKEYCSDWEEKMLDDHYHQHVGLKRLESLPKDSQVIKFP